MMASAHLPILTFHTLDEEPSATSFPPRVFQRGIATLNQLAYETLNLSDLVEFLQPGARFPERSLVITFDDGYRTVYDEAFPVLQRYHLTATVFLTVGAEQVATTGEPLPSLYGKEMLGWGEIREMQRYGMTFGAHTLTHRNLSLLPAERAETEIRGSKEIIEQALGVSVSCFAYPFGRADRRSRAIVREHFACACSDTLGVVHPGSDRYALERVDAYYLRDERLFALMPSGLFSWYIRAFSIPRRMRRAAQSRRV